MPQETYELHQLNAQDIYAIAAEKKLLYLSTPMRLDERDLQALRMALRRIHTQKLVALIGVFPATSSIHKERVSVSWDEARMSVCVRVEVPPKPVWHVVDKGEGMNAP